MITNIVFSGGSFNGIAYIGCIKALEELNILSNVNTFVGSSSGAIIATLCSIGYTADELYQLVKSLDFDKFKDITQDNIFNFGTNFGIDSGNKIRDIVDLCISKKTYKNQITFSELYCINLKTLILTGTCLNSQSTHYFSHIDTPDMCVCDAIRISISIPFLFNKCVYNGLTYVDGGLINNYPITSVANNKSTLGFCLKGVRDFNTIDNLQTYASSIIYSVITKLEDLQTVKYSKYTVYIKCPKLLNVFLITIADKKELYTIGYKSTIDYYNNNTNRINRRKLTLKRVYNQVLSLKRRYNYRFMF